MTVKYLKTITQIWVLFIEIIITSACEELIKIAKCM